MTLGQRIRQLRVERGWTQAELGQLAGMDGRNVTRYETDKVRPRKSMLKRLADAFDVSVDELEEAALVPELPIEDAELLHQFRMVARLNDEDKTALKRIISAVLVKNQVHSLTGLP
ncbi:MAG: helix-turn-helix transcriptional regulator [Armatimonadetes bacterium]|nr:helix-turn-helix transcriptional regulator [Armatimonadota bacterium]